MDDARRAVDLCILIILILMIVLLWPAMAQSTDPSGNEIRTIVTGFTPTPIKTVSFKPEHPIPTIDIFIAIGTAALTALGLFATGRAYYVKRSRKKYRRFDRQSETGRNEGREGGSGKMLEQLPIPAFLLRREHESRADRARRGLYVEPVQGRFEASTTLGAWARSIRTAEAEAALSSTRETPSGLGTDPT